MNFTATYSVQIQAIVSDNAANNDTMMQELASCSHQGMLYFPMFSNCLGFFQLLEGIGALSSDDAWKSEQSGYQESVTLPVGREMDAFVAQRNDEEDNCSVYKKDALLLNAVEKVCLT